MKNVAQATVFSFKDAQGDEFGYKTVPKSSWNLLAALEQLWQH